MRSDDGWRHHVGVNAYVGDAPTPLPWPACQACQFVALWIALALALGVLLYEVLDESVRLAAGECTAVVVHLVLVSGGVLVALVLAAQRTRAWMGEVRGRNRRYSRSDDSTVFASDYKAVPSDGVIGSLWGRGEPTEVFGVPDTMEEGSACARCSVRCWFTAPVVALGLWHFVAFALLVWATSVVDLGTLPTDPAEPASMSFSGISDKVTVEWVRNSLQDRLRMHLLARNPMPLADAPVTNAGARRHGTRARSVGAGLVFRTGLRRRAVAIVANGVSAQAGIGPACRADRWE